MRNLRAFAASLLARAPARQATRGPLQGLKTAFPPGYLDADQEYEPGVTAALSRLAIPGAVCADLGAHIGYFTLLMAKLSGAEGRVFAFEASPENARMVRRNVRLNHLGDRVTVEHAAVMGRTSGAVPVFAGRAGGSMEWTTDKSFASREDPAHAAERAPALEIRGVSLDEYFAPGSRLDLVKMDIEGAEVHAVPGMARVLREARPTIVLEFHRDVGWPAIPALAEAGYSFSSLAGEPLGRLERVEDVPYQLVAEPL
jgi:FkbM family methyltransferase